MKGRYGMGWGTDQGIASLADRQADTRGDISDSPMITHVFVNLFKYWIRDTGRRIRDSFEAPLSCMASPATQQMIFVLSLSNYTPLNPPRL